MRSKASCGTRDGSSVLSLGELFLEMSHFYECCIYSIHSCFWQSWLLSSCYSLTRVCPSGLRSPIFLFAYSYIPHWPSFCPSALVHSNHMASPPLPSPFPLETVIHCHDVLLYGSRCYSNTRYSVARTTCSILRSIFHSQVWSIFFSFSVSDHVWAP